MPKKCYLNLLSSPRLLKRYLTSSPPTIEDIQEDVFLDSRDAYRAYPDYIIKHSITAALDGQNYNIESILSCAISNLAETHLECRGDTIVVLNDQFESWQNIITRFPPTPIIAHILHQEKQKKALPDNRLYDLIFNNFKNSLLPSSEDILLDSFIKNNGLQDLHIHLNGTTEFDLVWQDALKVPYAFYIELKQSFKRGVKEQARQFWISNPREIFKMLLIAKHLRDKMIRFLFHNDSLSAKDIFHSSRTTSLSGNNLLGGGLKHPIAYSIPEVSEYPRHVLEIIFMEKSIETLLNKKNGPFAYLLHYYLIIQSRINMLLVQQRTQIGFDQFQKIADNKLRDTSEKKYYKRFRQLDGMLGPDLTYIEGRFSPKKDPFKNISIIKNIISDYKHYLSKASGHTKQPTLGLVAHFIKKPEKNHLQFDCRHYLLRRENETIVRSLIRARKISRLFKAFWCGIDAAANEMHTPPEVYAPAFRKIIKNSVNRATYHVGEDFVHLLSGLRSIYEAILFLNLQKGDRLGHCTAAGINPALWSDRIEELVHIRQGEWLDNLVFAYSLLREEEQHVGLCQELKDQIFILFQSIFGNNTYRIDQILNAWKMRYLDPIKATYDIDHQKDCLDIKDRQEWELIKCEKQKHPKAFDIFLQYHSKRHRESWDKMIAVKANYFSPIVYRYLQNRLLRHLNQRQVAIESMVTSNVRISFYNNYSEHHIIDWLGLNDSSVIPPTVCLSTDDPGIFATNIRNEYKHTFNTILPYCDDTNQALEILKKMRTNAKAYQFKKA